MIPTMMGVLSSSSITPQTQVFNSNGSFVIPAHVAGSLTAELFGAGGGGANTGQAGTGGNTEIYTDDGGLVGSAIGGSGGDAPDGFYGTNGGFQTSPGFTALDQAIGSGAVGGGGAYNGGNGGYLKLNVDSGGVHVGDRLTVAVGLGGFADGTGGSAGNNGQAILAWSVES
jgi:hypothetical protein